MYLRLRVPNYHTKGLLIPITEFFIEPLSGDYFVHFKGLPAYVQIPVRRDGTIPALGREFTVFAISSDPIGVEAMGDLLDLHQCKQINDEWEAYANAEFEQAITGG